MPYLVGGGEQLGRVRVRIDDGDEAAANSAAAALNSRAMWARRFLRGRGAVQPVAARGRSAGHGLHPGQRLAGSQTVYQRGQQVQRLRVACPAGEDGGAAGLLGTRASIHVEVWCSSESALLPGELRPGRCRPPADDGDTGSMSWMFRRGCSGRLLPRLIARRCLAQQDRRHRSTRCRGRACRSAPGVGWGTAATAASDRTHHGSLVPGRAQTGIVGSMDIGCSSRFPGPRQGGAGVGVRALARGIISSAHAGIRFPARSRASSERGSSTGSRLPAPGCGLECRLGVRLRGDRAPVPPVRRSISSRPRTRPHEAHSARAPPRRPVRGTGRGSVQSSTMGIFAAARSNVDALTRSGPRARPGCVSLART